MTDRVESLPALEPIEQQGRLSGVKLSGEWNLRNLCDAPGLRRQLRNYARNRALHWDLEAIEVLDNAAALLLWEAWGQTLPAGLVLRPEHQRMLERWQEQEIPDTAPPRRHIGVILLFLYHTFVDFCRQTADLITLLGQLLLDVGYLLRHPGSVPWSEISITIYESGVRALGITALVGFLIGIVLSYLSALQLKLFGAEIYIIDILGLSVIRELGPLLAAILVAGRSGSAMTAQIGIMRVTEELDALSAMGISHSLRLVLPKVAALAIVMPLIGVWTSSAALLGGMFSAQNTLDISYMQFFLKLPDTVPLLNVFIGLLKSAVFGFLIALVACHFGFRIKPNTESLGNETTNSVVASITIVIMVDAVFAILFMGVGMPI
ncbi:ABC transporter permease [Methylomicrobium sp. Wu6]|uniref:MlaE family ABC transporter permease n=1 Tax=Methylomicrobium sp. Wu6 TaxID=3107928 RepID=UPI002DD64729|nr:ABC transporter permease [Methylomicrobium sp. Wu6]MEC4749374.1 ABC transporter permease [Methylomicrobium sp. Wu6]